MTIMDYLTENGCTFRVTEHPSTFTAEQLAEAEHIPPRQVAKPVVIRTETGGYYLCVLPADRKISLYALEHILEQGTVELADELELQALFCDAQVGAEPPFGALYHLPTLMDRTLARDKEIVFQAGTHEKAVWMSMAEYKKLVNPRILKFSYPAALDEIESMPLDPFFYDPFML